jgi:hypothetical protein
MNNENEIKTLDAKHSRVSDRYQLIPTKEIAGKFQELGFKVDEYKQVRVRDGSRMGYQKHFVRLSHPEMLTSKHSDLKLQLLVTNSHDGSSSFKLQLGIFRLVCSNGLVVGQVFESVVIRHTRKALIELEPAIEKMVAQVAKLDEALDKMKSRILTPEEMQAFYEKAVKVRYGDNVQASDVYVYPRRDADMKDDLFTVYNVIQETLIRGSQVRGLNGRVRQRRAITNIAKDISINTKLFDLAYDMVA